MSIKNIEQQDYLGNVEHFHTNAGIVSFSNGLFPNVSSVKGALDYIAENYTTKVRRGVEKGNGDNSVVSVNAEEANIALKNGIALGTGVQASNYNSVVGKYNSPLDASSQASQVGDAFVVGNGTSDENRSNAFRISMGGEVYGGIYSTSGADFSEMYEWKDGNVSNHDRRGRFVTLDGNKIKFANAGDDIIGITSAVPCIVGDNAEYWHGKYETDVFGAVVYEEVTVIENGVETTALQKKISKDYDPTKTYIPREKRSEWSYVGQLGKLVVCDDGTCEVNGYCNVSQEGYATKGETGWRVLERKDSSHVLVLFHLK